MGKKKKKKNQTEAKEAKEEEDFTAMLKEFKDADVKEGRHEPAPPPDPVHTHTLTFGAIACR